CENLIIGSKRRKKKIGSYYTPLEVTGYINKLSIDNYLSDQMSKTGGNNESHDIRLLQELVELKILDPAVGTGHFLGSAATYLGEVYLDLKDKIDVSTVLDLHVAKKKIIKRLHSIFKLRDNHSFLIYIKKDIIYPLTLFGTDINPIAIKIAKSRLFLDIVCEKIINDDIDGGLIPVFNLKTGNALISDKNRGGIDWKEDFPGVFSNKGGFDVITGNPPYVNPQDVEYWHEIDSDGSKNLYDAFIRKSITLLRDRGRLGFIHPNSAYCQPKFKEFRYYLKQNVDDLTVINYAIRPQPVFKGVMQRTAITACKKDPSGCKSVKTSRYLRLTRKNRYQLLSNPPVYDSSDIALNHANFIPKIGNKVDHSIFGKVFSWEKRIGDVIDNGGITLYYHDSGESYWTKLIVDEVKGIRNGKEEPASHWKKISVAPEYSNFIACLINSSLFYWIWLTISDCRDLTLETLIQVPLPEFANIRTNQEKLGFLLNDLMACYRKNSRLVEKRKNYLSPEIKVNRCKLLIDTIDRILGRIYGLNTSEIDYLIAYDAEMRNITS
ncbi:MAG: Eco57I restriction-modification methylase domain-containing protein, partial [Candidatus Hodarchaeales archaeon]